MPTCCVFGEPSLAHARVAARQGACLVLPAWVSNGWGRYGWRLDPPCAPADRRSTPCTDAVNKPVATGEAPMHIAGLVPVERRGWHLLLPLPARVPDQRRPDRLPAGRGVCPAALAGGAHRARRHCDRRPHAPAPHAPRAHSRPVDGAAGLAASGQRHSGTGSAVPGGGVRGRARGRDGGLDHPLQLQKGGATCCAAASSPAASTCCVSALPWQPHHCPGSRNYVSCQPHLCHDTTPSAGCRRATTASCGCGPRWARWSAAWQQG